jgi:O-acetylhomoserine (thiol)-lyase
MTPIHANSTYKQDGPGEHRGYEYSRTGNPTRSDLEANLASLESGSHARCFSSGMGAINTVLNLLSAGDHVVAGDDVYGGTHRILTQVYDEYDVETTFVDTTDHDAVRDAIEPTTELVWVETPTNPLMNVNDIGALADIAHANDALCAVDNTFATPYLQRPLEHGADVVWESTTKWTHGSGTTIGGIVVDGGTFPWDHPDADYPELSGENPAFGFDFSERFGDEAFARAVRQRGVRPVGSHQTPFDAWATLQGLETLQLRMDRHCENARTVAEHLDAHEAVEWVTYPGLEDHQTHGNATEYLADYGGMVAFGLTEGFTAGKRLCEEVELAGFVANVGDARTLVIHPASTTHAQISEAEQRAAGVSPELIRLSVGLEEPEDITADLDGAIERATR